MRLRSRTAARLFDGSALRAAGPRTRRRTAPTSRRRNQCDASEPSPCHARPPEAGPSNGLSLRGLRGLRGEIVSACSAPTPRRGNCAMVYMSATLATDPQARFF